MVKQYPYLLQLLSVAQLETTDNNDRDENGDWVLTESQTKPTSYTTISVCRNERNSGGSDFQFVVDGVNYTYDSIIYAPKSCPILVLGSTIKVTEINGKSRIEGTVKRFDKSQMHTRIWV
jgi:carbonic anhydrase